MPFQLNIPVIGGAPLELALEAGEILFVLGANGAGKSSLMQRLSSNVGNNKRWISAHRQNWFASESISLSPEQKRQAEQNIRVYDSQSDSRWKDHAPAQRANIAIYELVDAENVDGRAIARAVRAGDLEQIEELKKIDPPIEIINELLKASNLPIELSIDVNQQVVASKSGCPPYSVAHLSDGERNALLIAANVLTAKPGTLILVDEPERHLHRSIISPLLTHLFKRRRDCAFIVSTHDVLLPVDNPGARTLLLRTCTFAGNEVAAWDADLVPSDTDIDEVLKADILGARKTILFVEGTSQSLDQPLYSLLFPEVSVIPKSSSRDVEHAAIAIRAAANLHWLRAFGIIDSDGRPGVEVGELKNRGIYAVPAYSVEALYYHPDIQRRVAQRHASVVGGNPQERFAKASEAALAAVAEHAVRMSEKVAEKSVRAEIFKRLPGKAEIRDGRSFNLNIDVGAAVATERSRLDGAIAASDVATLIARYPVRETPMLSRIAEQLGFQDREQYESAVLKLLIDGGEALTFVRSLFDDLAAQIAAQ